MAHLRVALLAAAVLFGCAQPREVRPLIPQSARVAKDDLSGTFYFLKSIVSVASPGPTRQALAPGLHMVSDKLVRFIVHEDKVDVVSIDPLYEQETAAPMTHVLASFDARNVDVERKLDADGDPMHEEEETQTRRVWRERRFVSLDLAADSQDPTHTETTSASVVEDLERNAALETMGFVVERLLKDGTALSIRYSFRRYRPSKTYVQRPYNLEEQLHFGLFRTTTFRANEFDQFTESTQQDFMNRWDTSKTIVFHFAQGFPNHLKPVMRHVFSEWGKVLKKAVGDDVLEPIRENTGQKLGDLGYNLIVYDDSEHSAHGILGYAPHFTNPRTGEILKADIVLYGKVLKRAIFQEMFWEKSRNQPVATGAPTRPASASLTPPVDALREFIRSDLESRITRMNEDVVRQALDASREARSSAELEKRVFTGVFFHEFGHALGLRHNFLGSADVGHYAPGETSSSAMDYSFLQGKQTGIGPYDEATIAFAYSPYRDVHTKMLSRGFYYCSDEEVFTSRLPLCQLYDSATSLKELVANQLDRYLSGYEINNTRLERLSFSGDGPGYERRILALLLPLRLVYDNAHALLQAHARQDWQDVWTLARQRVEAAERARGPSIFSVSIPSGSRLEHTDSGPVSRNTTINRQLDRRKIEQVVEDARQAKEQTIQALRRVVLESNHPDFDDPDGVRNRIQVRGVLRDKLLALSLIAAPTDHPLDPGKVISPYVLNEKTVPALFAGVLSNTTEVPDPEGGDDGYYRIRQFDPNLRRHALTLLSEEIAQVSRRPEAHELIRLQLLPVRALEGEHKTQWDRYTQVRTDLREFYRTLMKEEVARANAGGPTDFEFAFSELSPFELNRNQFDNAYTRLNDDTLFVAPVTLPGEEELSTASGLLIRNNLNVAEDYLKAISKTRDQLQEDLFRVGGVTNVLAIAFLDKRRDAVRRYVAGERLFLRDMYLAFTGQKDWPDF